MSVLVGILNLARDSFSDGGRFSTPADALAHARRLAEEGAEWIDVGAESTHPDAEPVSAGEELARLEPVVALLVAEGLRVSVDTHRPEVMARVLALGAGMLNDVRALRDPGALDAVRGSRAALVLMHSTSPEARAVRAESSGLDAAGMLAHIRRFFEERLEALDQAGIERERVILDPGMGLFLSPDPRASLAVLRGLPELASLGRPLYVSTSRKSFLGALTGRAVGERGAATLASELYAWRQGATYLRTHDVRALADALQVARALEPRAQI